MVTTAEPTIDQQKAEAFGEQVLGIINSGALTLSLGIGHRTGLFDTMARTGPVTSARLAEATGLNERYVREWLGAVTTGRIVEYDPATRTYTLPPEHALSLTRAAGPDNLATLGQFISLLAEVEDQVVESFRKGGGVPYSAYRKFHRLMAEDSAQVFDATLLDVTLPLVPGLVERLEGGIDVADVGCGAGHAINLMAQRFPNSRFTGYDFSPEAIELAQQEAAALELPNARFEVKDAATLDGSIKFDFITTFDAVHDQAQPRRVLKGIADSMRPDGVYLCVDIAASTALEGNLDHPLGPLFYTVSTMHCMTVSLALDGEGLGTMWGEEKALELLHEAGFTDVSVNRVEGDAQNNYYIARKG